MLGENEDHVCGLPDGRSRSSACSTTTATFERAESVRPFIQRSNQRLAAILRPEIGVLVHLDRRAKPTIERAARHDADSGQLIQERATCMEGPRSLPKCRRRRAALRGGCFTGLSPLCLGLSGSAVSVSGSCPVETSIAHCVIQSCEVRAVAVGPLTPCTRLSYV